MKRELKFRGWGSEFSHMIYSDDFILADFFCDNYDYIMQFTGMHDKNGVEIYEGDIRRWQFNDSDRYSVCYWSKIDCGFRWKLIKHNETQANYNHDIQFDTEEDFYDYVIGCNQRDNGIDSWSTIVGNIYSNPELL